MDIKHPRLRRSLVGDKNITVSQQYNFDKSLAITAPQPSTLPNYISNVVFAQKDVTASQPATYQTQAKAHKREQLYLSVYNGMVKSAIILAVLALLLASMGYYINTKYSGRALPFTKVGSISVGGQTKPEIVKTLATAAGSLTVSFQDGALVKTISAKTFNPTYDFEQAANEAVNDRVNPYSFIEKTHVSVKAVVNERQVAGYLRQNITSTQTRSADAYVAKAADKIIIYPEVMGFSANTEHVARQINWSLGNLANTKIKVGSVAVKPNVYAADLQPETDKVNTLLNTKLTVRYAGINASPTAAQKLSWLTITKLPGGGAYSYDFSRAQVREYVVGLAQKYQRPVKIDQPADSENPAGYAVPTVVLNNIEDVVDQAYQGLKDGRPTIAIFTKEDAAKNRFAPKVAASQGQIAQTTTVAPGN